MEIRKLVKSLYEFNRVCFPETNNVRQISFLGLANSFLKISLWKEQNFLRSQKL